MNESDQSKARGESGIDYHVLAEKLRTWSAENATPPEKAMVLTLGLGISAALVGLGIEDVATVERNLQSLGQEPGLRELSFSWTRGPLAKETSQTFKEAVVKVLGGGFAVERLFSLPGKKELPRSTSFGPWLANQIEKLAKGK